MPEWLQGNEWAAWLGVALILGVVEAATVDFVFLMLAGGALAAGATALIGFGFGVQVIVGVIVSIGLLGVVRPIAKRHLSKSTDHPAIGTARYIGQVGRAVEPIGEQHGLLIIDGDTWTARIAPLIPIPVLMSDDANCSPGRPLWNEGTLPRTRS